MIEPHAVGTREPHFDAEPGTAPATASMATAQRVLNIQFTGSGSEYWRIWIVNLLLTVVTLGFYYPYAKARRLRYFHANTLIDGHALGFHGDPRKMLRGYVLMLLLAVLYGVAGKVSPTAGLVALVILAVLWPALWRASLQFRLGNTSWRGLRFGFEGDLRGAYAAMAVLYLPALLVAAMGVVGADPESPKPVLSGVLGLAFLVSWTLLPLGLWRMKRYQHDHYRYAQEHAELAVGQGAFYKLGFKVLGVNIVAVVIFGLLVAGVAGSVFGAQARGEPPSAGDVAGIMGLMGLFYLAWFCWMWPYGVARLQNLVWSGTRSAHLRFDSQLTVKALAGLTLKNLLLTAVTLGLYRPFAAVATARLRLEAVRIELTGSTDAWMADAATTMSDASGDAAGDFFGIDLGL